MDGANPAAPPAGMQPDGARPGRLRGFHPGWYGAVMGTAIVGIIAYQNPGQVTGLQDVAHAFGTGMVGLAALLAVVLGIPYVLRWVRHTRVAIADLSNPLAGALYGTFPGGILVLAVGIATVGPALAPQDLVVGIVAILGAVGTMLSILVGVAFAVALFSSSSVEQHVVNGAWFIPPVVTIIIPLLVPPLVPFVAPEHAATLVLGGYAFWGMGFVLFLLVASLLYSRLVFHPLPQSAMAPTLWIQLGPVGVGSLALLRLAEAGTPVWGDAASTILVGSSLAAGALWGFGLWWLATAAVLFVGYLRRTRIPYGLGWWGLTFPLGAFTASTLAMGRTWHAPGVETLAVLLFFTLATFWTVVAVATLRAVRSGAAWQR